MGSLKTALPFLYMIIGVALGFIVGIILGLVAIGMLRAFGIGYIEIGKDHWGQNGNEIGDIIGGLFFSG